MVVYGGVLDPHACWLLQRGLATLALRVRQQTASALALAHFLEKHPQVKGKLIADLILPPWSSQWQKVVSEWSSQSLDWTPKHWTGIPSTGLISGAGIASRGYCCQHRWRQ